MELEARLTGDDFGFKMEEKSWLHVLNTGWEALTGQLCVCRQGQDGAGSLPSGAHSLERGAEHMQVKYL